MKVTTAQYVRKIDRLAMRVFGIRGLQLMENAGRAVADLVKRELKDACCECRKNGRVAIITGKGNNGGDGFVAARHLKNSGVNVTVFSLSRLDALKGDAAVNASAWRKMNGETFFILTPRDLKRHESALKHSSIVVDGIFGTGLSTPVRGLYARVIDLINVLGKKRKVVAIDIPSGIDASTGGILGVAVKADITATMAIPKAGLFIYPGRDCAGRVEVADIGAPRQLLEDESIRWNVTTPDDLRRVLKPRRADTHKGTYGHLLVLAGSPGKTGAAYMAAMGAMRVGVGLATLALPESLSAVMESKTTEVMTYPLPETSDKTLSSASFEAIRTIMEGKTALCIGPGLGTSPEIYSLLKKIIDVAEVPMVIDADGLNALSRGRAAILKGAKAPVILTPHPGELSKLLKTDTKEIQADRIGSASRLAQVTNAVVVLKGAATVISYPDGKVFINPTGNPGLSTAGTGDVLSGMISGLLAQGIGPGDAAFAAAYIHGLAGDIVKGKSGEAGLMATDLLPIIPNVLRSFIVSPE